MKFKIDRTSTVMEKPCEEAFQEEDNKYSPWYIEFETLDNLMAFIGKYGQVLVCKDSIEIYDDYRE